MSKIFGYLYGHPSPKYSALSSQQSSCQDDLNESIGEEEPKTYRTRTQTRRLVLPWILSTVLFASLSIWLILQEVARRHHGSFERGFTTDFRLIRPSIEVERVVFTGSPRFNHTDGSEYIPLREGDHRYVGPPSEEIDRAWDDLTEARFIVLNEAEARDAWGESYLDYWSEDHEGYPAELDVFHTLHCLSHIRKSFYPDAYPIDSPIHGEIHRDHCIDHLRQMVMCNGDVTPIPTQYYPEIEKRYINSDLPHTCRKFDPIRNWVIERHNRSKAV